MHRLVAIFSVALMCGPASWASPRDGDFDPLLDEQPSDTDGKKRIPPPIARGSGFTIGGHFGFYAGSTTSVRTQNQTRLQQGWHPSAGLQVGYRTSSVLELNIEFDLGLGQSYASDQDEGVDTINFLVAPSVLVHWYDAWPLAAYAGLGGLFAWLGGTDDLNAQNVVGPNGLLGFAWRSDAHSSVFIEAGGALAYNRDAIIRTTATSMDSSESLDEETGQWLSIFRVSIGYRLTAF